MLRCSLKFNPQSVIRYQQFALWVKMSNREHPVAYGGRALRNEELRWHITDKEGLSLVEAIRQFRPYLANVPFTVYTDNVSMKYLQQIKD